MSFSQEQGCPSIEHMNRSILWQAHSHIQLHDINSPPLFIAGIQQVSSMSILAICTLSFGVKEISWHFYVMEQS